jgi:hypothetical protein
MDFELQWGGDPEDLLVTASGIATVEDFVPLKTAIADPRWRPPMRVLLDFRQVDWSRMSAADVERRVGLLVQNTDRIGRCYTAVAVTRDLDYGMVRMQQALSERRVPYELEVFRSVDEARGWLRQVPLEENPQAAPASSE